MVPLIFVLIITGYSMRKDVMRLSVLFVIFMNLLFTFVSADTAEYFYDDIGRLIATVSDTGDVTIYTYDEAGNLISISKDTFSPNPPVIQSINPDILFIGTTTLVSITGQNFLTTKKISTNNPLLSFSIITVTDTEIRVEIITPPQALPGIVNLTVTTQYGSASIQASLTTSLLSFGPSLLSLTPGSSGTMKASIYPLAGKAETIQIKNSDSSIISVPQSVTIPANGTAVFSVNASREGIAYITSGPAVATVIVTASTFTPVSGEQLTIKGVPVSAYIDAPSTGSGQSYTCVSACIDTVGGNSVTRSLPFSVLIDSPSGSPTVISIPVSTRISP
jgi:YD repeat-containing protein